MANPEFFKDIFDELAINEFIGDPAGKLAYAYLRVSSSEQAEEGRSGLPRQLRHVHEIAVQSGLKISWDMVFADDHTGFEFRDRPNLTSLRREYSSPNPRAVHIVIEHIDRLSRNADWHQGYLLDEMKQHGLNVVFWKAFSGRVERAVMGAVAQDAMEQAIERMYAGRREKAISGRVTSPTKASYGYKFVDSDGAELTAAKQDSYYAVFEPEAKIVRYIYEQIAFHGNTLRGLARQLQDMCPPPGGGRMWRHGTVRRIVTNPAYKGEFAAFRMKVIKKSKPSKDGFGIRIAETRIERPPEDWITVPVPAIVEPAVWELANQILEKNKRMSKRNGKNQYLLTGLVKCATCGRSYSGWSKKLKRRNNTYDMPAYRCGSKCCDAREREEINCTQSVISCRKLDDAVWSVICTLLLEPATLIEVLEQEFQGEQNLQLATQIRFIEEQIQSKEHEDEKLYRAYVADVFDETEYAERRRMVREQCNRLAHELGKLNSQIMTQVQFEEKKQYILTFSERVKSEGLLVDAPFEVKQQILKMLVEEIVLNTTEGWFRIEGAFPGIYRLNGNEPDHPDEIVTPRSAVATRSALPVCARAKRSSIWAAAAVSTASWPRGRWVKTVMSSAWT
jgi:site-specific DNA recombinase